MTIMQKLTVQNLKQNKKRTVMTILGILLSTALICAVVGMVSSGLASLVRYAIATSGDFHVQYNNIPAEDASLVSGNVHVVRCHLSQDEGYALMEGGTNEYKPYYYIVDMTEDSMQNMALNLLSGRFPEKEGEIVISDHIYYNGGVQLQVGDTLSLEVGRRVTPDGYDLNQSNPLNWDEETMEAPEEMLIDTEHKEYTIVGIVERPSHSLEDWSSPGYTLISWMDQPTAKTVNLAVTFDKPAEFYKPVRQIEGALAAAGVETYTTTLNTTLLEQQGALSQRTLRVLYTLAGIILAIIIATSVFVIRNSFAISVSEKTRQYGMLASVGATARQIRRSVLFEGLIIGLIGIPLGVLLGVGAVLVLIQILNLLLNFMDGMVFVYSIPLATFVLTVVLGGITIFLSCLIPAIRASHVAPIEAIRGNNEFKISSRKLKTSPLTRKLFGIGGVIARKNLKRSRRKYRTTVVSLVVSVTVFIALSSFVGIGKRTIRTVYTDYSYNLSVYSTKSPTTDDAVQKYQTLIETLDEKEYGFYYEASVTLPASYNALPEQIYGYEPDVCYLTMLIMPEDQFASFAAKAGVKSDLDQAVILIDDTLYQKPDGAKAKINTTTLKEKEKVDFTYSFYNEDTEASEEILLPAVITKRTEERPIGMDHIWSDTGFVVVSEKWFPESCFSDTHLSSLFIRAKDANQAEIQIHDLENSHADWGTFQIQNLNKQAQEERNLILVIEIFLYGFLTVITLIGVTNIFNTISTNVILRRKEFAMLRSVGMTDKQFRSMIRLENIF